jgi:hypothetical protein
MVDLHPVCLFGSHLRRRKLRPGETTKQSPTTKAANVNLNDVGDKQFGMRIVKSVATDDLTDAEFSGPFLEKQCELETPSAVVGSEEDIRVRCV